MLKPGSFCPSVWHQLFSFKGLLLKNHYAKFNQTW